MKSCETCRHGKVKFGGGYDEPPWTDFDCNLWSEHRVEIQELISDYAEDDCFEVYAEKCGKYEEDEINVVKYLRSNETKQE